LVQGSAASRGQNREINGLIDVLGTRTPSAALQTIESAADELTETTLIEVTTFAYHYFSIQLQDSPRYAIMTGRQMTLKVRADSHPFEHADLIDTTSFAEKDW
jgi:hypothetical protein